MEKTYIDPPGLEPPPEPYSHVVRAGDTVYVAGQVAFDEQNRIVGVGDPAAQAERTWRNVELAVTAAGGTIADVVKMTLFLQDIRHAPYEIAVRERLFAKGRYPVCTMVQVANLGLPDLLMEIDVIAVLG